jgi:hypothetical protein
MIARRKHERERQEHTNAQELEQIRRRQARVLAKLRVLQSVTDEAIDDLEGPDDDGDDSAS